MQTTIARLQKKLDLTKGIVAIIEGQLQDAWNQVFKRSRAIKAMVKALDASSEYSSYADDDCLHRFTRVDDAVLLPFIEHKAFFETFLQDFHFIEVDWDNSVLHTSEGPNIIINEDGDVLDQDSGKWIISKRDYTDRDSGATDIALRNRLIEAHMEKTGIFPGVFRMDQYGNVTPINTKAGE